MKPQATHIAQAALTILTILMIAAAAHAQPGDRVDPKHPQVKEFEVIGEMVGSITTTKVVGVAEEFGRNIYPVGDYNRDGLQDFVVERIRCDTVFDVPGFRFPTETLLFAGVRDTLPSVASGIRIGPTQIDANTEFLCAGDYDDDGWLDLVMSIELMNDTSYGNTTGTTINYLTIFWGNDSGSYSVNDTSQLPCATNVWVGLSDATTVDLNADKVDDIVIVSYTGQGYLDGKRVETGHVHGFLGEENARWNRSGKSPKAALRWWLSERPNKVEALDHDLDGVPDVIIQQPTTGWPPSWVTILYGNKTGNLPDTNEAEFVDMLIANGYSAVFADVTGDGAVEMLVNCGSENRVKIYAGRPGQRLEDQYAYGYNEPIEGHGWWRRPWAEVWEPARLHDGWFTADGLLNLGDGNLDGLDDIWLYSVTLLICYTTGETVDSLIDGMLRRPGVPTPVYHSSVVNLGDIDGSGIPTIAVAYDKPHTIEAFPGGIWFFKPRSDLPMYAGKRRPLPHLGPAAVEEFEPLGSETESATALSLLVTPNPLQDVATLRISVHEPGEVSLVVFDVMGRLVTTLPVLSADSGGEYTRELSTGDLPSGTYLVQATNQGATATTRFLVVR